MTLRGQPMDIDRAWLVVVKEVYQPLVICFRFVVQDRQDFKVTGDLGQGWTER